VISPVVTSSAYVINELEARLKMKIRENEELKQTIDNYEKKMIEVQTRPEKPENSNELIELRRESEEMKQELEITRRELDINDKELEVTKKELEITQKELDVLKKHSGTFKEDLEESVEAIKSYQNKIFTLLEENTKLNKICQDNMVEIKRLNEDKSLMEKTCKDLEESNDKILKETHRFEKKIEDLAQNFDKLTEQYLLICVENYRIHEILEGYSPENDPSTTLYIGKLENEKLILENEAEKWKLEYNNLQYLMKSNEDLIKKNQELNNTINNLFFSQSVDEEKYQKVVSELVEKIKFMSMENERLNNIILNRCKEMMNYW